MKLHIEVQDHKVELITKPLGHIPFVKIQENGMQRADRKTLTTKQAAEVQEQGFLDTPYY